MELSTRRFALRTSVVALCGGLAFSAAGQSMPDQTQVGLERAVRIPTEIIWLRDEILAELWRRNPRLDAAAAQCAGSGNVKQGCTIGNPPAWRYTFGSSVQDSRFKPLTSGVYLIASRAESATLVRAPSGAILLAAGTSVQLIDAAYPGIQIELIAPPDQPLPLGNLAAAEAGRIFALLARQAGGVSASAASVLENGRVALKSQSAPVQLANAAPGVALKIDSGPIAVAAASISVVAEASAVIPSALVAVAEAPVVMNLPPKVEQLTEIHPIKPALDTPRVPQEAQRIARADPDIARLRSDVEAEIERDRVRIANLQQQSCNGAGRPMQGCTISTPRRFAFAG